MMLVTDHDALIKALGKTCMTAYEDGKGGHLFRSTTPEEQADRLLASGVVIDAATLADDEALVERFARLLYVANEAETGAPTWEELVAAGAHLLREHYITVAKSSFRWLAAALAERGEQHG